jgi:hypothetical protein
MPEKQMKNKYKGKNLDSSLWLAWMGGYMRTYFLHLHSYTPEFVKE